MESTPAPEVRSVVILKADRLYAETLREVCRSALPRARIHLTHSVASASEALNAGSTDVLITDLGTSLDGDVLELIAACKGRRQLARHVLVVTAHREYRILSTLHALGVEGVFDSGAEPPAELAKALQVVARGGCVWSRSVLTELERRLASSNSLFRLLTLCEQRVLSVIGDGSDNFAAARELGITPATVSTVRRALHRKLGVQHRGELVRLAAQNGFVRFTPSGVVRPGFAILAAAWAARRVKRGECVA